MDYIEIARNGNFVFLVKNKGDKKGIILDETTGKKWSNKTIKSTLSKTGWELEKPIIKKVD